MNSDLSISRLDHAFARFLGERSALQGAQRKAMISVLERLSARQAAGHSCICLTEETRELVQASGLVSTTEIAPLVLERDRLYTQRYWFYEQRLARQIAGLCEKTFVYDGLDAVLEKFFGCEDEGEDGQKKAAGNAMGQAFSIITGGPGTGKTTTVVKILAILQELTGRPQHIALAAPTGKAAMRLQESIGANLAFLPVSEQGRMLIPKTVTTIHHLLGALPPTPYFRHDAASPLPHDLLVVDEASMVDLALMSKLVDALKPNARLILLGDKDQLASVESGAVLADLTSALPDHTLELHKAYRFHGEIKALADAINQQQAAEAWELLLNENTATTLLQGDWLSFIVSEYRRYLESIAKGGDFKQAFTAFNSFQVLCSNRHGPRSVNDINHYVERSLIEHGLIRPTGQWYAGRPVMINENNAAMQLFNGDIGICLQDVDSGQLRVFFLRPDGSVKTVLPGRMPRCETAYAMTIHKSQGSEFDQVLIALAEQLNPVLTKELLYTGVTRAKKEVKLLATESIFRAAVGQKMERESGLAEKIVTY